MADQFWDPIYRKALDDIELFRLIAEDSPDGVLLELVKPHPVLSRQTAPFQKKGKITNRAAFLPIFLQVASQDALLRRILLFGWIEANRPTLAFVSIPPDERGRQSLQAGEFGPVSKLRVLARLDPREGAKPLYAEVCVDPNPPAPLPDSTTTEPGSSPATEGPEPEPEAGRKRKGEAGGDDLRRDLGEVRSEARDLRKRVKELERERGEADRRNTTLNQHLRDTELALDEVRRALTQTNARVQELERLRVPPVETPAPAPAPTPALPPAGEHSDEPSTANPGERIRHLETVLARREQTVERLEAELESSRAAESRNRGAIEQAERLRERLAHLEEKLRQRDLARPVRLLLREAEATPAGFRVLIETLHGERLLLPPQVHPPKGAVEGEWLLHVPASGALPDQLLALEDGQRLEIVGCLREGEAGLWLEAPQGLYPVAAPIPGTMDGTPAAGVWLPAAPERPAGIHALRLLPLAEKAVDDSRLSFVSIQNRLELTCYDREAFARWAHDRGKTWVFEGNGLSGLTSAEAVISDLRRSLPVELVCEGPTCRRKALARPFVRGARPGEICSFCHEECGEPAEEPLRIEIRPSRILIAGGDAVGMTYREAFARHGIDVTWISGFAGLGGLREGMKEFRLVVVILKQISHSLLREVTLAARQSGVRLVFSPRRGVSGVLRLLAEKLK